MVHVLQAAQHLMNKQYTMKKVSLHALYISPS